MIRIGKEKVKTGCVTCKRRRVKCDETRPSCGRCLKAGKPCEGYAHVPASGQINPVRFVLYRSHTTTSPVARPLSGDPDLSWQERRALSYFQGRTASELNGAFYDGFWITGILPLARQEDCVRHALIALSSMHEHFAKVDQISAPRAVEFALQHYGRAIREVVELTRSQRAQTFEYTLVTCALFSIFEGLQGQYHEACQHVTSGMKLLAEQKQPPGSSQDSRIPTNALNHFFIAMGRQIMEIGDLNFEAPRPHIQDPATTWTSVDHFSSHEDALSVMEGLMFRIIEYSEQAEQAVNQGPVPDDVALALTANFNAIMMQFEDWKRAFRLMSSESNELSLDTPDSEHSSSSSSSTPLRSPAFLILEVYQAVMTSFLARVERNDENALNEFLPDLVVALDLAEEFIQCTSTFVGPAAGSAIGQPPSRSSSPGQGISSCSSTSSTSPSPQGFVRPTFSLALGIVPTLFMIASHIDDVPVRSRALSLLKLCNRREGLWDSRVAAQLVERLNALRDQAKQMGPQLTMILSARQNKNSGFGRSDPRFGVNLKLLNIKFLPGRKCMFQYRFVARDMQSPGPRTGFDVLYMHTTSVPGVHPPPTTANSRARGIVLSSALGDFELDQDYFEEMGWDS